MLLARPACVQVPADPTQGLAPRVPGFPEAFPDSRFSTLCCVWRAEPPQGGVTNAGPGPVSKGLQAVGDWTHTAVIHTTVEGRGEQRHQRPQMSRSMHHGSLRKGGTGQANRSKCRERDCSRDPIAESLEHWLRSTCVSATMKL